MRVVQNWFNYGNNPISDIAKLSLVASAIQWKKYFPKDDLILYVDKDTESRIDFTYTVWKDVIILDPRDISTGFHDTGRFKVIGLQEVPFIYLDSDIFLFQQGFEVLNSFRASTLFDSFSEKIAYYDLFPRVPTEQPIESIIPEKIRKDLGYLDGRTAPPKGANTGWLMLTPRLAQTIGTRVCKLHRELKEYQNCNNLDYSKVYAFHEFLSGVVPVQIAMELGAETFCVQILNSTSKGIHTFQSLVFSDFDENYHYDEGGRWWNFRKSVWTRVFRKIIGNRGISREQFLDIVTPKEKLV